jgi:hypothetical protein
MATSLVVSVKEHRLIPASHLDWEMLDGVREGVDMSCKLTLPRSLPQQRWYRGLVTKVATGCGLPHSVLHENLRIKAGLWHINISGEVPVTILHSTAFDVMDGIEFTSYIEFALMTIMSDYLPGIKRSELIREIDAMTNIEFRSLKRLEAAE